jgi:RNA polymerase subunit RPABC4/transcription elongation factor Spt4
MEDILQQIGQSFSDIVESDAVQFGVRAIGIYLVILWLATAYWAFRDMQQRSDNAILPYIAAAGIILFTPIFFIFAVWVYKIIRPHEKIGEVWERNLAEEALLAEVDSIHHCPTCERRIDDEWIICPSCRTRLKRVCPNCSRLVGMDWSLCAWCGKDFERREVPAAAIEALPRSREATGRLAATGTGASTAAATPTALPTTVRSSSSAARAAARPVNSQIPAPAQDPLPER